MINNKIRWDLRNKDRLAECSNETKALIKTNDKFEIPLFWKYCIAPIINNLFWTLEKLKRVLLCEFMPFTSYCLSGQTLVTTPIHSKSSERSVKIKGSVRYIKSNTSLASTSFSWARSFTAFREDIFFESCFSCSLGSKAGELT